LVTFSRTSTDEPLISGETSGVTQVNSPGSVGGCSEAVKSPCRLSIWKGMSDVRANPPKRHARWGLAVVLLALVTPPGTLLLLRSVPSLDVFLRSAVVHLVVVGAISACALAVAVAAATVAGRSRDGSLVLLALGCLAVGFLMLGHGLVTPGIGGRPGNQWVGRLPVLAITAFAACLSAAVEARDAYTHGHSARVADLSVRIGLRLGLGLRPALLRTLAEGAYLHDVGKVGIPDHVLNKPGALTGEERAWVQQHPLVGSDIVGRAPSLRDAIAVIRQHHERYDGGGYPDGLAGEQISLAARIVAVADVWDALTSDRAYRPAWPPDRALRHMERGRGTHFDPACLDAFLALMAERGHRPAHEQGDATVADAAAEACHDQPETAELTPTPPA
jgi:HD-GYP domain-containing protein (c-di-GMP phosphodiesterase class II)